MKFSRRGINRTANEYACKTNNSKDVILYLFMNRN